MNGRIEDLTGTTIVSETGVKYKLLKQVGSGAQGVVYEEASDMYMVKMYYPSNCETIDNDIVERLRFIQNTPMPSNFVSVEDIITKPYIGYVMPKVKDHVPLNTYLIPSDKSQLFHEWYNGKKGLYGRIFTGYIIAKAFAQLEKSNLSYCDISGNNILVNIKSGGASVKLIDIDNVYVAGKGKASILGTPRYIAPEVINRRHVPDVLSDNYALAVILFELLRVGHPYISDDILDGTPEDEEKALSGLYDYVTPENSTNMLPEDVVFTDKLKKLFERCFVDGKSNRMCRPSATEFEHALLEASNKLIKCSSCGAWYYPRKEGKSYKECPWCEEPSSAPARLNFYDILFEGENYKKAVDGGKTKKLVNTYILKPNFKNVIKNLYVLRSLDRDEDSCASKNYLLICFDGTGYCVRNEYSKAGIFLKRFKTGEYVKVRSKEQLRLHSGDEIYFEFQGNGTTDIECGGKRYSFIRMARFVEVEK